MLPKKYHAIAFICILVMLLLLGLHLLSSGYTADSQATALARNSTGSQLASSSTSTDVTSNQAYKHPIVYDKLTGATNNQINDILGATKQPIGEYPIDHYLQQQQQARFPHQRFQHQARQPPDDGFFMANMHRPAAGFLVPPHPAVITSMNQGQQPAQDRFVGPPVPPPTLKPASPSPLKPQQISDSVPSASSLNNDGTRLSNNGSGPNSVRQQQQQQQQQLPIYYTPPIFSYNQNQFLDPNSIQEPLPPQLNLATYGFARPQSQVSVEDHNARLRQQQPSTGNEIAQRNDPRQSVNPQSHQSVAQLDPQFQHPNNKQSSQNNLLADPQQQQKHRQQMLDRQLLFGSQQQPADFSNQTSHYPDPALYRIPSNQQAIRPPYANQIPLGFPALNGQEQLEQQQLQALRLQQPQVGQNRMIPLANNRLDPSQKVSATTTKIPTPILSASSATGALPVCAQQQLSNASIDVNSTTFRSAILFCNIDPEYPTRELMRALELYANERSIEQLLPQQLIQIAQPLNTGSSPASLTVDQLQSSLIVNPADADQLDRQLSVSFDDQQQQQKGSQLFQSSNYEPMCRSTIYMAQPRRAKNLMGQWKVIVNLPGHKYRGIAISQAVRVEECSRQGSECISPTGSSTSATNKSPPGSSLSRSSCLQHYENQRLVAWSNQQGLHLDIFRIPVACSCHIRRLNN